MVLLGMLVRLVTVANTLVVKEGTSIDPACLPCWPACLVSLAALLPCCLAALLPCCLVALFCFSNLRL
jgi:hypothetical protein